MDETSTTQETPIGEPEIREFECETCEIKSAITVQKAFNDGWDYPPFIGTAGVVSARTCPNCGMESTAWWALITGAALTAQHRATIERISKETFDPDENWFKN